jgi:hypothetical protein
MYQYWRRDSEIDDGKDEKKDSRGYVVLTHFLLGVLMTLLVE